MPNTVKLHRVLATRPDKVYRAFLEPDALAKWLPPNGYACTVHQLEAKVGGSYRMSFRNFSTSWFNALSSIALLPVARRSAAARIAAPESAKAVAIIEACYTSARTGKPVHV